MSGTIGHERVFDLLWGEVASLAADWALYQELYCGPEARVDKLNRLAGEFFGHIQVVLGDRITLAIARLTDVAITSGNLNLSLATLADAVKAQDSAELAETLEELASAARAAAAPFRAVRHKRLAHTDVGVRAGEFVLEGVRLQDVRGAYHAITRTMDSYQRRTQDAESDYVGSGELIGSSIVGALRLAGYTKELLDSNQLSRAELETSKGADI